MPRELAAAVLVSRFNFVNYFELLGLPESVVLDSAELRKAYFERVRLSHPDHSNVAREISPLSGHRDEAIAELNQAYETLRNWSKRVSYILDLYDLKIPNQVPAQWASEWFELQDEMNVGNIRDFSKRLESHLESIKSSVEYAFNKKEWAQFSQRVGEHRTLTSLMNQVVVHLGKSESA